MNPEATGTDAAAEIRRKHKEYLQGAVANYYAEPIVLDSALVGEGLTLAAAPSCEPVISGGRPIEGFEARPDGTWRTVG